MSALPSGVLGQATDAASDEAREQARQEGKILHVYQLPLPVLVTVVPDAQAMPEVPRDDTAEREVQTDPAVMPASRHDKRAKMQ